MTKEEAETAYRWIKALEQSKSMYPDLPVLVMSETTVTGLSGIELENIMKDIICSTNDDLTYLADYLDKCQNFTNPIPIDSAATTLYSTSYPNGLQAIMFSRRGRNVVLGDKVMHNGHYFTPIRYPLSLQLRKTIEDKNLSAKVTYPTLFDFDLDFVKKESDLLKANLCSVKIHDHKDCNDSLPVLWFLLIVIVIVVLAWIATRWKPNF